MSRFHGSAVAGILIAILAATGCASSPTTPSGSTTVTTIFASRILVGGSAWRSFNQTSISIVTARLASLSLDTGAVVRIGFGNFDGTTCSSPIVTADAPPNDTDPQLTAPLTPGRYCLLILDIGNLTVMNDFAIVLVQP